MTDDERAEAYELAPYDAGYIDGAEGAWHTLRVLMFTHRYSRSRAFGSVRRFMDTELAAVLAAAVERAKRPLLAECEAIAQRAWGDGDPPTGESRTSAV